MDFISTGGWILFLLVDAASKTYPPDPGFTPANLVLEVQRTIFNPFFGVFNPFGVYLSNNQITPKI
jgi:hypothetical protein